MNEYDSKRMGELLEASHGLQFTDNPQDADVLLLNTCSIREKAQEKVFSDLGRWKKIKDQKKIVIGVGGCVASQEGEAILKRAPYVDIVFGPQTLHRLPELLNQTLQNKKAAVDVSFPEIEKFDRLPEPKVDGPTAFVTIMEGCSKYCSFCVVPYTRGEEVSRPFEDVITEIAGLAEKGVKEVTLLGQNVNGYRGPTHDGGLVDLAELVTFVAEIEGVERIRYTTSHPLEFSQRLIDVYAAVPKLVNHLHLPVQSGSDRILGLMKRNHTILEYKSKIRKLRKIRPDISISTDLIVGFPGETDKEFEATLNLVAEIGFDNSFSFIYSPRPGTPAAELADPVPLEVKKERLAILQARLQQSAQNISQQMRGFAQPVLVENVSQKNPGELFGRTENNRAVMFKGGASLVGKVVDVTITDVFTNSMRGCL